MSFKDNLQDDMDNVFLNVDELAEEVTYVTDGGVSSTIKAVVDRRRLLPAGEVSSGIALNQIEIYISKSSIDDVVRDGDTVTVAKAPGSSTMIDYVVKDVLTVDDAMWRLLLQA